MLRDVDRVVRLVFRAMAMPNLGRDVAGTALISVRNMPESVVYLKAPNA